MTKTTLLLASGAVACLLAGAGPAAAQWYDDGFDGALPGEVYGYGAPYGYPPPYAPAYQPGYGYNPHRETFVGPYGYAHRRCRPHKACYN